jgi:hypothetical protein
MMVQIDVIIATIISIPLYPLSMGNMGGH